MIKSYLDQLGNGDYDSKVLNYISICRAQAEYDEMGVARSLRYENNDELCMIDHLSIAEIWYELPRRITKSKLIELQKDETICEKDDDIWRILLYKIEDIELLKELGTYDDVLRFVKEIENTYSRFLNCDYSRILRRNGKG
jgi:hypothetical protein